MKNIVVDKKEGTIKLKGMKKTLLYMYSQNNIVFGRYEGQQVILIIYSDGSGKTLIVFNEDSIYKNYYGSDSNLPYEVENMYLWTNKVYINPQEAYEEIKQLYKDEDLWFTEENTIYSLN